MPLKLYRRKGSENWYVRGTIGGKHISETTGTTDRQLADVYRINRESELQHRRIYGAKATATFAEAVNRYLDGGGEARYLHKITQELGMMRLCDIDQAVVDQAARKVYPNAMPSTVNRQFYTPFIAVMNLAAEDNLCNLRNWRRPRDANKETKFDWRTPEQIEQLLAVAGPYAPLLTFYVGTGVRASEALNLTHDDISPAAQKATIWETKGGYSRQIDLSPRVRACLPPMQDGKVWRAPSTGEPWHAYDAVNLALKRICKRNNIPHLSLHTLRHTYAT